MAFKGTGKFKEYSWNDVLNLIYADMGLKTDEERRAKGEIWFHGQLVQPEHALDKCLTCMAYDKTYQERMKEFEKETGR